MATVTIIYDDRDVLIKSILRSAILAGATQVATKKCRRLIWRWKMFVPVK